MTSRRIAPSLSIAALLTVGLLATAAPATILAASAMRDGGPAMELAAKRQPGTQTLVANCNVNLRASASTSASIVAMITGGSTVTTNGTVSGGAWSATCGTSVSGSSWYKITAVNGVSVSTLYGVSVVYGATGLFVKQSSYSSYLEGIDISHYQGTVNFGQVKSAGKSFVIAKASEGIGYADANYSTYRSNAMSNGLAFTAYHFARPDLNPANPTGEADWFVDTMNLTHGMLIPALDLEVHGTLTSDQLTAWVQAFLGRVYERTGARAMIYASPSFWTSYMGNTAWFATNGYTVLWVAHWTTSPSPTVPASSWGGRSWTFWQYSNCGTVAGISGCVDLDRFNGKDMTSVTY